VKRLLLLGAGHAHLQVLAAIAAEPLPSASATLLSPFPRAIYSGMVPGLVAGHYAEDECAIELAPLAQRARVELFEGCAIAIDAVRRIVRTRDREIGYDVLSIDTGAVIARETIPGAREHGLFVRPIEHFVRLWRDLEALAAQRPLSVAMIGGGAAGAELAMAIQHRLAERARVCIVTGGPPPLQAYLPDVRRLARAALKRHGITVFEDSCTAIGADHLLLGRGMRLQCDAPVIAIGPSAPPWLAGSGLALDAQGFVATGATLQSVSHAEVFAAGDVASRTDAAHPRSGVYAVRAGPPLALNLRRLLAGGVLERHTPQLRSLNLISCGERSAIASWGPFAAQGRWVWRWKDRIDRGFVASLATRAA
jgi:pyridine nucleotide-disulfide oxidoreductase family protein